MKIGVLALQGAFAEHIAVLRGLGIDASTVRLPKEMEYIDGLIIPGGESTTISRLMVDYGLLQVIKERAEDGLAVMGTCAGMVVMAKEVTDYPLPVLSLMDMKVQRNAFGRQVDSFEADLEMPVLGRQPFHAVFIRAPIIERLGEGVQILARVSNGTAVAARQGKLLSIAFHPELTNDARIHQYFLELLSSC